MSKRVVRIVDWNGCPFKTDENGVYVFSENRVWFSPDFSKAVLEVCCGELFAAVRVTEQNEQEMICEKPMYTDFTLTDSFTLRSTRKKIAVCLHIRVLYPDVSRISSTNH